MEYIVYCTSNQCDGHVAHTLEGTLQEAIDWFRNRFDEVSVDTVMVGVPDGYSLFPCLVAEERDDNGGYWRYAMTLWTSEI